MALVLLNEDELRQTINLSEALSVIEGAFVASAEGRINIPGNFLLKLPDVGGEVDVKGAYLQDAPYYVVKVNNHFQNNPSIGLLSHTGLITVFDAATGFPAAILLDNNYLSQVRSGVVGALAAQYLAASAKTVAVIGTGPLAFIQLKALMATRQFELINVWGETPLEADTYARRLVEDHDVNIRLAASIEEAVAEADLVIAAAMKPHKLINGAWLKSGAHVTTISGEDGYQKLHPSVFSRAEIVVADNIDQCAAWGDIHHAITAGAFDIEQIHGELKSLILGEITGRTTPHQVTVADLSGLDWQDTIIATLALDKALFLGLGQRLEYGLPQYDVTQRVENLL